MKKKVCPQCEKDMSVGSHPTIGEVVCCDGCGAELEIVWLDPIRLDCPIIDDDSDEY